MFMVMQNIYEGLFWFLIPVCLVICNDIMAYVFGKQVKKLLAIFLKFILLFPLYRIFLWPYKTNQSLTKKDMGRIPWGILLNHRIWIYCKLI